MLTSSKDRLAAAALLAGVIGGVSAPAGAQPIGNTAIEWNAIASTSIMTTAGQPPHAAVLSLAMVQGAVYDAVNAIDGGYEPYLISPPANSWDSKDAAAATAAFRVLVGFPDLPGLFPAQLQTLQSLYDASLATVPNGSAKDGGIAAGEAAARAMLTARANDGRFGPFTLVEGFDPGEWRRAPPQGPTGIVARIRRLGWRSWPRSSFRMWRCSGPTAPTH